MAAANQCQENNLLGWFKDVDCCAAKAKSRCANGYTKVQSNTCCFNLVGSPTPLPTPVPAPLPTPVPAATPPNGGTPTPPNGGAGSITPVPAPVSTPVPTSRGECSAVFVPNLTESHEASNQPHTCECFQCRHRFRNFARTACAGGTPLMLTAPTLPAPMPIPESMPLCSGPSALLTNTASTRRDNKAS